MPRYIDADKINAELMDEYHGMISDESMKIYKIMQMLDNAPIADVQEVKHGKWIEDGYENAPCVCSCCGAESQYVSKFNETFDYDWEENLQPTGYEEIREYIKTPYCSQCGAKMDLED